MSFMKRLDEAREAYQKFTTGHFLLHRSDLMIG